MAEPQDEIEVPLVGGNVAPVVRVGDTVRRITGRWTPAVHALLRHLDAVGFNAAPRVLGIDDRGREVLSFIPGDAGIPTPDGDAAGSFPSGVFDDASLVAAAKLTRRYHDAVTSFVAPSDARWRRQPGAPQSGEIICHNDLALHNTIYRAGLPVAFIDWDLAAPGSRLWDIAYALWRFVPLYNDADCETLRFACPDRPRRIATFCSAYGLEDRTSVLDVVRQRQHVVYDTLRTWGEAGEPGFDRMWAEDHGNGPLRDIDYLDTHREHLDTFLEL